MRYGKIINGEIQFAKNPLWIGDKMIANPTEEHYKQAGFLPISMQEIPQRQGYYYEAYYQEVNGTIYQLWQEKVATPLY